MKICQLLGQTDRERETCHLMVVIGALTHCTLGNFSFLCCLLIFSRIFPEHYQSVKQFGSRSGPTESDILSVLIWVRLSVLSRQQKSPTTKKETKLKINRSKCKYLSNGVFLGNAHLGKNTLLFIKLPVKDIILFTNTRN